MTVLDNAKQFEKMAANLKLNQSDSSKLLELAKKFNKSAQQSNADEARKIIVNLLTNQWRTDPNNFPLSAREVLNPLMYPKDEMTFEELKDSTSKIFQILMNTRNQNTMSFAQNQLMPYVDNLDKLIASQPSIPAPATDAIPEVNVEDLPKANKNFGYPSIPVA